MFEFKIAKCKKKKKKVKNRRYLFEDMLTDHIYEIVQGHTLYRLKGFCKQTKERFFSNDYIFSFHTKNYVVNFIPNIRKCYV